MLYDKSEENDHALLLCFEIKLTITINQFHATYLPIN